MNKILKIIAFIVITAGVLFIGFKVLQEKRNDETEIIKAATKGDKATEGKESALPVKALKVVRGDLPLRLNISASADVWEKAMVKAETSGKVERINFNIGQWVPKGSALIQLDDTEKKLDVDQQKAEKLRSYSNYLVKEDSTITGSSTELSAEKRTELAALKQKYLQSVDDFQKGKIQESQFEAAGNAYQEALIFSGDLREEVRKAQEGLSGSIIGLKRAELDLMRTTVKSPFDGMIATLAVSKGEKVSIGQDLFKVVNLKSLYLKGYALESEISKIKVGTKVRIRFDSFPEDTVYGELAAISPEIDPERKTLDIYVKVNNPDNRYLPGMHAAIDIEHDVIQNVMKVPQSAVIPRQGRYLVFIVKDLKGTTGTAYWEYVELGDQNDEEIEIRSAAIKEGDLVLVDGHYTLAHQSHVKIQ